MAQMLAEELRQLGLEDILIDEHATVTARKPGNQPTAPRIGLLHILIRSTLAYRPIFIRNAYALPVAIFA